ncbi:MAG: flavodoxin [Ruminococcus sp.]
MQKSHLKIIALLLPVLLIVLIIVIPVRLMAFDSDRTLIVYFSRVGNTQFSDNTDAISSASLRRNDNMLKGNCEVLAEKIQQVTRADIFAITVSEQYPESYEDTVSRASSEQAENMRPTLVSHVDNMDKYENIILIYPVWWSTMPMPVFSFLEEYDFSDKNIYPVTTHKGSFLGHSVRDIKELCPEAKVHTGIPVSGGSVDFIEILPVLMIIGLVLIIICTISRNRLKPKSLMLKVNTVIFIGSVTLNVLCVVRLLI